MPDLTSTRLSSNGLDQLASNGLRKLGSAWTLLPVVLLMTVLAGCGGQVLKHGQQFADGDIQQVQTGMSKEQVKLSLGSPSTTTTATSDGGETYYYISSTATQAAFFKPTEVDRKVVAVYFNQLGSVDRVANYGIKDGKVFDFISRTTPAPGGKDEGLLKQLFRNLGSRQIFGE
ncbi:MAG: outer membrane protein assembly factor BamE [Pseudomonadota bacterium]